MINFADDEPEPEAPPAPAREAGLKCLHPDNEVRADTAEVALEAFCQENLAPSFRGLLPDEKEQAIIADLIANLGHVAMRHGLDLEVIHERAADHFTHENDPSYDGD